MTQKIRGAFAYPTVIIFAMSGVGMYMMIGVLPKVSEAFSKLNIEMPLTTRLIMDFGIFVGHNTPLVIISFIAAIALFIFTVSVKPVRKQLINLLSKINVIKKVLDHIDVARYARTLSTLNKRGVDIIEALEISADTITQPELKKAAKAFSNDVSKGKLLSEALVAQKDVFPSVLIQTVKAGEKTGMLDKVLEEMAEFYESEVARSIKKLTDLLEPVLILVIGVLVGAMVVMLIAPIYNVVGSLQNAAQK